MKYRPVAIAALVLLLLDTGMRISSAKKLTTRHLDLRNRRIHELWAKGGKYLDYVLSDRCARVLELHIAINGVRSAVFPQDIRTLRRWVEEVGQLAGAKIHPHKFRHTFATTLMRITKDVKLVQQAMGHSSLQSTTQYLERSEDEIRSELDKLWTYQQSLIRR